MRWCAHCRADHEAGDCPSRAEHRPLAKAGDVFTCQAGDAIGVRFVVDSIAGDRARMKVVHEPVSLFEVGERSLWNHSEWRKEPWTAAPTPAAPPSDLRALVRARMLALGMTQAALAERLTARLGGTKDSHVRRLSRWQTRASDIGSDALADVLSELGLTLAPAP